jgi:CRP/FNR family transcriptional regulator, dissimilatory nitrate respiration regulator
MALGNRRELLRFVRGAPLFAQLAERSFESIGRSIRFLELERGTGLFNQDEPANLFFLVIEGWIKVYRTTPAGAEAVIGIFTRGQSFAEIAALANDNYPANAVAVSDVLLAEVPIQPIRDAIANDPQVAMTMLASVSRHVRRLVDEIEQMKGLSGAQRVIEFIVQLSPAETGPSRIQLPYEKSIIARKVGMKAESLSRVFKNLRKHGVVIENDTAIVDDVGQLRRALEHGFVQ